jgi:hypothetical protein
MTEVKGKIGLPEGRIFEVLLFPLLNLVKGVVPMGVLTPVLAKQRTSKTVQTPPFS